MNNFTFYAPTSILFGKNTESQVGNLIKNQGAKSVLLHFGGQSAEKSGLLTSIRKSLKESNINYCELGGVVPNPRLSLVYTGINLCKENNVDFILAVGGGSVIDSAKAIAFGVKYDGDVWDFYNDKVEPKDCVPLGCVLTISAAGSEMSNSTVITKDEGMIKRGASADCCRLKFSILNPELTYTLPAYQTSSGIVDIIMHTMERYFTKDEPMMMTDSIAESVIKTVITNARILINEPENYNARAEIMWAGSLSHNGLTGLGATHDWATHQLEHELSGMFDVAHGAGLSAIWGSWARYVYNEKPERFETFAKRIFDIDGKDADTKGIEAMEAFFKEIKMPISIPELLGKKITDKEIDELTEKCAYNGREIGGFKKLDKAQMREIYVNANK